MSIAHHPSLDLTDKQRAFAESWIETGGNATEAVVRTYNCSTRGSARVIAHKLRRNPKIIAYMNHLMLASGLPDKTVDLLHATVASLEESLTATKPKKIGGKVLVVPDEPARSKARREIMDLWQMLRQLGPTDPASPPPELDEEAYWAIRFAGVHKRPPHTAEELEEFQASTLTQEQKSA